MTVPIVRQASGPDVIASVPYHLGFMPTNSLVVISLKPPRGRLGMISRFDLEPARQATNGGQVATQIASYIKAEGGTGAFVIRFVDTATLPARHDLAVSQMVKVLRRELDRIICWDVAGDAMTELDSETLTEVGPVHAVEELTGTRTAATMTSIGATYRSSRAELADLPKVEWSQACKAMRAETRARDARLEASPAQLTLWRQDKISLWHGWLERLVAAGETLDQIEVPPNLLGQLAALLEDSAGRDAVVIMLATGRDPGVGDLNPKLLSERVERAITGAIANPAYRTNERYAEVAPRLLRLMLAHQAKDRRGPGFAVMAWDAWWHSDGARAEVLARAAMGCSTAPLLAMIVLDLTNSGILPQVVRLGRAGKGGKARKAS